MSYLLRTLFYSHTKKLLEVSGRSSSQKDVWGAGNVVTRGLLYRRKYFKHKEKKSWFSRRSLLTRWTPLGLLLYGTYAYNRGLTESVTSLELHCYCHMPLRIVSKVFGKLANKPVPPNWREFVYGNYSKMFCVNLEEAQEPNLMKYSTLLEFFTRKIKAGSRIVDKDATLVSPCDGKVLCYGQVQGGQIEQVKGVTYSLQAFFGKNTWSNREYTDETDQEIIQRFFFKKRALMEGSREKGRKAKEKKVISDDEYYKTILVDPERNCLHQCVIYLAPGDYHRFHSPCNWIVKMRRHFSGKLLSVNPALAKLIPGLFCLNERVVYIGLWKFGFFSYIPVGATNVGSIKIYKDDTLHTNGRRRKRSIEAYMDPPIDFEKGEMVGQFNMGSTIVLIFEAPKNFKFTLDEGNIVKMGQKIGYFESSTNNS